MASTTRTLVIIGAAAVAVGALPGCSDEPFDDPLQRARYASLDACQADWGDT
ncbi:MAG TPA: hypothetical protein PK072_19105 [Quisquiliibacterium sp.]|nr:hypothetical protein [Quisquiliibacterium sp.]